MADAVKGSGSILTPEARLKFARSLEDQRRHRDALFAYYSAIIESQRQGRWLSKATTPPALVEHVAYAMRYVKAGRRREFGEALEPVVARHGPEALARFQECLAIQVGELNPRPPDPRQKPSILYFPGLPAAPYFKRSKFPWLENLERGTSMIRDEVLAMMPRTERSERVFASDEAEHLGLKGGPAAPTWSGFYFYRHGERRDDNHSLCPRTSAILETLPLVRIREHAPEVMFSVLTPGTHILPHRGVTNTRVVGHLPLIVPEACALVVGGERHVWREGEAIVFDDTYEHEAWNRSNKTRVVLIVDVWNPHLTDAERDAVAALVGAMGDFNKAAGI